VDAEQRVEAAPHRVDDDVPGGGRGPAVPDRLAAEVAAVVRLARLLRRADVRAGDAAARARERLRGRERIVRRPALEAPLEHGRALLDEAVALAVAVDRDVVGRPGRGEEADPAR